MSKQWQFRLAPDIDTFENQVYYYGYSRMKLGDMARLWKRFGTKDNSSEDSNGRPTKTSVSGSKAKVDDALFLRILLHEDPKADALHLLFESGFITEQAWIAACTAIGCDIDKRSLRVRFTDDEARDLRRPLRAVDDFIDCLHWRTERGQSRLFGRDEPGAFYAAAKVYDTYRNLPGNAPSSTISDSSDSSTRMTAARGVFSSQQEAIPGSTRTGRTDEERQTNFVTAWLNGLCYYHNSTRRYCTLIPDRIGFTVFAKKDPSVIEEPSQSSRKGKVEKETDRVKIFAADADAFVPKKHDHPIPREVSAKDVLFTVEVKPPGLYSGPVPHEKAMVQVALQVVARIAALHDPFGECKSPIDFDGSQTALVAIACGFECVLVLATYESAWVRYILDSASPLLKKVLTACDFIELRKVAKFNILMDHRRNHALNAIFLALLIQEYELGGKQPDNFLKATADDADGDSGGTAADNSGADAQHDALDGTRAATRADLPQASQSGRQPSRSSSRLRNRAATTSSVASSMQNLAISNTNGRSNGSNGHSSSSHSNGKHDKDDKKHKDDKHHKSSNGGSKHDKKSDDKSKDKGKDRKR